MIHIDIKGTGTAKDVSAALSQLKKQMKKEGVMQAYHDKQEFITKAQYARRKSSRAKQAQQKANTLHQKKNSWF